MIFLGLIKLLWAFLGREMSLKNGIEEIKIRFWVEII